MKQKVLLLMVLALGMCSIGMNAQTKRPVARRASTQKKATVQTAPKVSKKYQVEKDGFEWYRVTKVANGQVKYGAEDRYGNIIAPTEYDFVSYTGDTNATGFLVHKGEFKGWYNKSGKCIIPFTRGYTMLFKEGCFKDHGTNYTFYKPDGGGICDKNGKEVVFVKAVGLCHIMIMDTHVNGKKYYFLSFAVEKNGERHGAADANGKIIVPAEYKDLSTVFQLLDRRITTTNNPLAGNSFETVAEAEGRPQGGQSNPVAGQRQQQQNGRTKTTVVEHHHDPVPVQQWQACFACGGMGTMGCDNCGGSGTKYIGNSLYTCSRCNGRGIIPCNTCYGNKGQYVTVYK